MSPKLFVSAFQGIKTYFINNTMEEGKLRDAAHKYVDTQTSFANMLIDNTITVCKEFVDKQTTFWFPRK